MIGLCLSFTYFCIISDALIIPVLYDASNNLHRDIKFHPEQPARIQCCIDAIKESDLNSAVKLTDVSDSSEFRFTNDELDYARECLVEAHSEELVASIEVRCRNSRKKRIEEGKSPLGFIEYIDDDTYMTTETYDVCLRATATWIRCVNHALGIFGSAMALTRPPGHHATSASINGFCIFNFAAAAAIHAMRQKPDFKVTVLDWDVHFGQGVSDILKKYERARYVSIHQTPAFPFMGENLKLDGSFNNVLTIPIKADMTWSTGYSTAFREHALPFVLSTDKTNLWVPDLVIVCSGYDALLSDELASVCLKATDYGHMTRELLEHLSKGKGEQKMPAVMLGLEGGYQLDRGVNGGNLGEAVVETIKVLTSHIIKPAD